MMLTGRIEKERGGWYAECDVVGVYTQGKSRQDALEMLASSVEVQLAHPGLKVTCTELGGGDAFDVLVDANHPEVLIAAALKEQRLRHGLSVAEVAKRLGSKNHNAYAVYEQGKSVPSVLKFREILAAIAPELALRIGPRHGPRATAPAAKRARKAT